MLVPLLALIATPADIDPAAVERLVQRCRESESWGLVVLRDGKPVVERNFGHQEPCNMMSATKSVTSMAVGLLLGDGKLTSVDTPLKEIFPQYKGAWKNRVTLRHLLEHTSGIRLYQNDPTPGFPINRVASALEAPVVTEPGTEFEYNNRAVDLLSGVVRRLAGMPLDEFVDKRLFKPLGIPGYYWDRDPDGNPHGCAELILPPRDMAKLGQLMLDGGVWNGKRLLPETYVKQATATSKITEGKEEPCGWLWWACDPWFSLNEESWRKLEAKGLPIPLIERLKPLAERRYPGMDRLGMDIARTLGGSPMYEREYAKIGPTSELIGNAPNKEFGTGYFANGWGGQYILVLPKERIVAVRTCGDGFFDTKDDSKYEMGDFYHLVRSIVK